MISSNQDNNDEIFKARRYFLLEGITKNYDVNINRENFYDQPIDSDIKWDEEIRKLVTGQCEYCTKGFFVG